MMTIMYGGKKVSRHYDRKTNQAAFVKISLIFINGFCATQDKP